MTEVEGIPGMDPDRAHAALSFHQAIREAVAEHVEDPQYRDHGYGIKPIAGIFQPTSQSAMLGGGLVNVLLTYAGRDEGGDGTVPSVSATPVELSNQDLEIYVRERHASLQNADHSLDQVIGLLRRRQIDQTQRFAPGTGISLDLDDAYLTTQPVTLRALPESEWADLTATVTDVDSGAQVANEALTKADDGWHYGELPPLSAGAYRVVVRGGNDVNPVTDVCAVAEEGVDVDT